MTYELKAKSERRARLSIGGVNFRTKNTGVEGNKISVVAVETGPKKAKLIVTNHNTSSANVIGPVDVSLIIQQLNWDESFTISPSASGYSISSQIAATITELGAFRYSELFHLQSKLSIKLTQKPSEFAPDSIVRIVPRCQIIDLVWMEGTLPDTGGYSIEALRTVPLEWIELDVGVEEPYLSMFEDTYLTGGDGLPERPVGYEVSPTTSLVVLNQGEDASGTLVDLNKVFQWDNGWQPY